MTSIVAVAGGHGNVGRTVVDELKASSKYKIVVLSRKEPEKADPDVPSLVVNYDDEAGIADTLASHNVDTVISALMVIDEKSSAAQVALIRAAASSKTTRRFIASEWGFLHPTSSRVYPLREAATNELNKTDLEWTRFLNGYFMDYYGLPHVKSHMHLFPFVVDVANKAAGIPGTGDDTMAFTYTLDLAKFVVASLGLDKWEHDSYCYSERLTMNKVLSLAEEARGSKFDVVHDPVEKLQKHEITELPGHIPAYTFFPKPMLQGLFSMFGLQIIAGAADVPPEKSMNAKFPEIQTTKMKEMVGNWKGH